MFEPSYVGPIQGWTVNFCHANLWRVASTQEWDDLMQESFLVYLRVKNRYTEIETPQHFMALYKRAWIHHFTDLAYKDSHQRHVVSENSLTPEGEESSFEAIGELHHDGDLAIMLKQAPNEILMVLNLFLNAPTELIEVALASWSGKDRRCKAGGSKQICKMLGLPADLDVMEMLADYFQPAR